MRIKTYALGIAASLGITAGLFGGCGGTVAENTGASTSSGGSTSATTTTASTTTTTVVTTTTSTVTATTSTTTTGTTPCDMACAHVQMCFNGLFTCAQANINCATLGSSFDCEANCVNNTSCADLGVATLTACENECAGDGGTADGGSDAGTGAACQQCGITSCATAGAGCFGDATCMSWLMCVEACNGANPPTASCYAACDAMYASASSLYAPIYTCACTNCTNECPSVNLCAQGQDGGP